MSTAGLRERVRAPDWRDTRGLSDVTVQDAAAGASVAVVVGAYLSVLYHVVEVVGGRQTFLAAVAAAVVLAGVLRALPWKYAVGLASTLLVGGLAFYLTVIPPAYLAAMSPSRVVFDTVALLTGYSVLRMPAAGAWATAVAPAPTFLAAYLAFRGRYAWAAGVASAALGFFVLTGDSATTTTLVGVLAASCAVGFGTLAKHDAGNRQAQVLAAVLAVMVLGSATVTAVPGGRSPLVPASTTAPTGSLVSADSYVGVGGSIRLNPKVQFVVEANQESYYRVNVYNRFTGSGWVRTANVGKARDIPPPSGDTIRQRFTAKRTLNVLPSAPMPQSVDGVDASVSEGGLLTSGPTLYEGDTYEVVSREPVSDRSALADETGSAPAAIRERYLQVPSSTSGRVVDLAGRITSGVESNYGKARAVERWLEANKEYSLDARDPRGNLVNAFVLRYDQGYCVYFASAMVVMLRSQGVPARYVTGYTPGQRVSEDTWVVRGVDSHAWVEVYVPNQGWVRFDPTPSAPRQSAERERVQEARQGDVSGVDAAGSANGTWTPTPTTASTTTTEAADTNVTTGPQRAPSQREDYGFTGIARTTASVANITAPPAPDPNEGGGGGGGGGAPPSLPPLTTLAVWGTLLVGGIAAVRYTGVTGKAYRALWLRWLPSGDPREEIEAAFERAEYVLSKRYRERKAGETVREYVADVRADTDERVETLVELRERARYAGRADGEDATEAKRLARSLAAEISRLPGPRR